MSTFFKTMKIHLISNYKSKYPDLKGKELTNALIKLCEGNPEMEIKRTPEGKPYAEGYNFSVSHSGDIFACAFADSNVGIDIQHSRNVKADRIAERYFTEREAAGIESEDDFFRLWTRKEAYAKYTGRGLAQIMTGEEVIDREDVIFKDMIIRDPENSQECFCSVCAGREDTENIEETEGIVEWMQWEEQ